MLRPFLATLRSKIPSSVLKKHWHGDAGGSHVRRCKTTNQRGRPWGADAVLLVPAVVNPQTSYRNAWTRSQAQIRKLIPLAEELKSVIAIEEVWNRFLLSPLEMANYVDEFHSPWVRVWFDVGNIVFYGYPQDWIRTLGKRIVKLHLKDFKRKENRYEWTNLGDGDVDWGAVRQSLTDIGYCPYRKLDPVRTNEVKDRERITRFVGPRLLWLAGRRATCQLLFHTYIPLSDTYIKEGRISGSQAARRS